MRIRSLILRIWLCYVLMKKELGRLVNIGLFIVEKLKIDDYEML